MDPERIVAGDLRALARAATAVENQTPAARQLLTALWPRTGRATIIGVTGPPGVGKSTLVDQVTACLRRQDKSVGIVAVDPSSPFSRGAILGDRIRMQRHHADEGVFIRSMASRGKLGGLARGTLDMVLLLDASGRDVVIVETVGVGQDEIDIARLADVVVLVLAPGFGDDVQAIKAGVMEIADVFAINKSDLPGAERLEQEIRAAQSLAHETAPLRRVVASDGTGVDDLLTVIEQVRKTKGQRGQGKDLWAIRLREMLRDALLDNVPQAAIEAHAELVANRTEDPYAAVAELLSALFGGPAHMVEVTKDKESS